MEAPFRNTSGWIGADGNYSVLLDNGRVAWLFSDTFVGAVRDGKRLGATMINNSIGIQRLDSDDPVRFCYGTADDGQCNAFVTPGEGEGFFWLFDGVQTSRGLYFFLTRVKHLGGEGAFSFKLTGMGLAHVSNSADDPGKWSVTQRKLPFARFDDEGSALFGSATLKAGAHVYIYGIQSSRNDSGGRTNNMIVARVPEGEFGDFSAWRFLSGGKWGQDWERCDGLFAGIATEFSVSFVPSLQHYAAVYTGAGISGIIEMRLAPAPEGPWSDPVKVYECPDKDWHSGAFAYAGKAHPELATAPNELIVTYAANSNTFEDLLNDARLYWPRFVRLRLEPK